MLVYGRNVLKELDKKKIKKIYISSKELIPILKKENLKFLVVPKQKLDSMVSGNHQGIVMEINDYEYYTINDIDSDFVVILDHLEDPHNFGAIIRTCEAAGITNIIIPNSRSTFINDTVVKTSVGAIERVKIILVSNIVNAINELKNNGYFVYAADMDGDNYKTIDYTDKKVLIIGNEGKGVSKIVRDNSDFIISIPMKGKVNSLNASVSAAILIYGMMKDV